MFLYISIVDIKIHTNRREHTQESAQSTEKRSNTEPYVNLVVCANLHAVSYFRDQANNQCRCRRFTF